MGDIRRQAFLGLRGQIFLAAGVLKIAGVKFIIADAISSLIII